MVHNGATLAWFDNATGRLALQRADIHEGTLWSVALSGDGALVATAASDGLVRLWDAEGVVKAVAFVDDRHLAIAPDGGDLLLVTTDPAELLELVRSSLTRGFTATECRRFGFGDECPTLTELRGRAEGSADPAVLDGTYEVSWTDQQFNIARNRVDTAAIFSMRSLGDVYPGTYTVTMDGGRFDIVHDEMGAFCTGSYDVSGGRVRFLAERSEPQYGCLPGRFLEAAYTFTADELAFDDVTGHPIDVVLFAGQPLIRIGE
jgi:hypothetical protein